MILGLLLSLVVSLLIGALSIGAFWRPAALGRSRLLLGFLAAGIGLGLSSCGLFLWLFLIGASPTTFPLAELGLLVILGGVARYGRAARWWRTPGAAPTDSGRGRHDHLLWSTALWLCVACATIAFLVQSAASRHGGWDAWMTWNMHARAMFRGGGLWREVLTGLPDWSHPDYPLLLPASVVRVWIYMGRETELAPPAVAMLFTFATVGLLYASVSTLRSRTQGVLAASLLLATKFFILHGASQYADIPLAFFFLATLVLLALSEHWPDSRGRLLALAGTTAGLAAWTKNEGLLFVLAIIAGFGLLSLRARGPKAWLRETGALAIGLLPILAIVVSFKLALAPPNDLMSDQGFRATAERLLEGERYVQVLRGFTDAFLEVGAKGVIGVVLLAHWVCAGPAPAGPSRAGAKAGGIVLCLMLAGYAAVLLTAPAPILGTYVRSTNRLLLQLWPSMLFAYFLAVRTAEEAGVVGRRLSHA